MKKFGCGKPPGVFDRQRADCPGCGQPVAARTYREQQESAARPATDGIVRVSLEPQGPEDKGVTVVNGVALDGQPATISWR
ncbi:hypothetical protein [Variovorax sp. WS11]|uniref:hypothetical protein n=1 Tax=Variovorax sp. WS11 TaxID=1105204 RepID=UPI0013DCD1B4|nr:hypothetical protein [Variovorax sp. WS11]NDZ17254.1 hypothetical protein [Variovorax sp. WS11]